MIRAPRPNVSTTYPADIEGVLKLLSISRLKFELEVPIEFEAVSVRARDETGSEVTPSRTPVAELKVKPVGRVPLVIMYENAGGSLLN